MKELTEIDQEKLNPVIMAAQIDELTLLVDELIKKQFENMNEWIKIGKFCEIVGETKDSFKKLRDENVLAEGLHWKKRPGSNVIYVNIREYNKWLSKNSMKN